MANETYIEAGLQVRFHTPFHLGAGHGDVSVNRVVRRSAGRQAYVPASALKGALRMAAERVVQVVDRFYDDVSEANKQRKGDKGLPRQCKAPDPKTMCQSHNPCLVCRVFGNVFTGARLMVDDGYSLEQSGMKKLYKKVFKEEPVLVMSETITRVQIDRRNRGSSSGALFSSEYIPPVDTFSSRLSGRIPLSTTEDGTPPYELVLLAASVKFVEHIGAEVSVGRGHCTLTIDGADGGVITDTQTNTTYSVDALIDHLEELPYFDPMQ